MHRDRIITHTQIDIISRCEKSEYYIVASTNVFILVILVLSRVIVS